MNESFGARLRRRREEQGIALVAIAEQTKIKQSLLEALERDDVSQWPSGIFRRAFIRSYALAIGLDPDVVVREFLEVHAEPDEVFAAASAIGSAAQGSGTNGGPPTRLRQMVGSAFVSLGRLRRGPAAQDPAVVNGAPATLLPPAASAPEPASFVPEPAACVPAQAVPAPEPPGCVPEPASFVPAPAESELRVPAHPAPEPPPVDLPPAAATSTPPAEPASPDPDFLAVARLCTEFGRVESANEMQPLLREAAGVLDATGLIVWIWDGLAEQLKPALVHGYSDRVRAQLPAVGRDAANATAAAFRSAQMRAISGSEHTSGALVVPLLTPAGCAGVLAIELQQGREQVTAVHAAATIFAALLAQLVGGPSSDMQRSASAACAQGDMPVASSS